MYRDQKILVGKTEKGEEIFMLPKMANRHGLIAGATGTGKTVTLKVLAESFSDAGVPVFFADVKGDLAGCCQNGVMNEKISSRLAGLGIAESDFTMKKYPVNFWDVYGEEGMPLRTTITEMGPILLARILGLTEVQTDLLTIAFKVADDNGMLLIDTKDLKAMLNYVAENADELAMQYGNITKQSLAVIVRSVVALETEGADLFFGEPALSVSDWLSRDCDGKGVVQILDCRKLVNNPTMYATFLLWMMSELFETLPEVGDLDKPKMVFFFDEAHLLFTDAPKSLLTKIEQVVKLIRSKGVGIYFITQSPGDIPDGVLAQLGNKVQHALHAYTPSEQKAVKAAAMSYRENPEFDTYETIMALQTGEAICSMLDENGVPGIAMKTTILPPQSLMGGISEEDRRREIDANLLCTKYSNYFDRDSAYEFLQRRNIELEKAAEEEKARIEAEKAAEKERIEAEKAAEKERIAAEKAAEKAALAEQKAAEKAALAEQKAAEKEAAAKKKAVKSAVKGVASSTAGTLGRQLGKTLGSAGGSFGKTLGGNVGASLGRGIIGTLFKL
ncbi:MAG: DUF853 domain-containing protein [Lachnospiraceae bacterium]|nr:DUF853 domain-containing protein [Lachnospiraceae bacterium]